MLEWVEYYGPQVEQAMLVGCIAGGVWWLVRNRPRRVGTDEPLCGRCGYNVTALPSKICPECGSDLDSVGVIRGGRPSGYAPAVVFWSVAAWAALFFAAAALYPKLSRGLPVYKDADVTVNLSAPASKAYQRIRIKYSWRGVTSAQSIVPESMSLWIDGDTGAIDRPMAVDAKALRYGFQDQAGQSRGGALDAAAVLAWMKSCQLSADDALLAAEAREVVRHVHLIAQRPGGPAPPWMQPPFGGSGQSSGQSVRAPVRPWITLMAAAFLVWAAGVWVIGCASARRRLLPK